MTEKGFPFSGTSPNDAGPYTAAEWALIWQAITGSKTRRTTSGVFLGQGDGSLESLLVEETSPVSLAVVVREGWAIVNGYIYMNDDDLNITIPQNTDPADDRIDTIALQLDINNSKVRAIRLAGTPAPVPVAPTLTQSTTIWEIRIADITVESLDTDIVDADIDNTVRNYGILRLPKEGGTGIAGGYVSGDLIVGQGVEDLTQTNIGDFEMLVGDTALTPPFVAIDKRPITFFGAFVANGGGSFTQNNVTTLTDPTGYATLNGSGRIELVAGTYEIVQMNYSWSLDFSLNPSLGMELFEQVGATQIASRAFDRDDLRVSASEDTWGDSTFGAGITFISTATEEYAIQLIGNGLVQPTVDVGYRTQSVTIRRLQ